MKRPCGYRIHPLAYLFPRHSDIKRAEILRDIRYRGQRTPVVLYQNKILDGIGRAEICDQLGIELKTVVYEGDDPLSEVLSLNLHRRDLSTADRRKIIEAALKSDPSLSDRLIAGKTGSDHKTVGKVRKKMRTGGEIPHPKKRTGRDGKAQSSSKRPVVTDSNGMVIPDVLLPVFDGWHRRAADNLDSFLGKTLVPIQLLLRGKGKALRPHLDTEEVIEHLGDAARSIKLAWNALNAVRDLAVCPECRGEGCDHCLGAGWRPAADIKQQRGRVAP